MRWIVNIKDEMSSLWMGCLMAFRYQNKDIWIVPPNYLLAEDVAKKPTALKRSHRRLPLNKALIKISHWYLPG